MVNYVEAGVIYPYPIKFIVDGELVTPTSATITVKDNNETVVQSINDTALTIPHEATSMTYSIPANANAKTLDYEIRFVTVKFVYNSVTYKIEDYYVIEDSLKLPITKSEVRSLVAMSEAELPDSDIDLINAKNFVQALIDPTISTLISSGSSKIPKLSRAIIIQAAMNAIETIELRVFQSEQADNTLYKRFASIDFAALIQSFKLEFQKLILDINDAGTEEAVSVTLFIVQTGTDPVTGA